MDDSYPNPPDSDERSWKRTYRFVFLLGLFYILALGLFTWLFNTPFNL